MHKTFFVYVITSLAVVVVLTVDPWFNKPDGLLATTLFTGPRGAGKHRQNTVSSLCGIYDPAEGLPWAIRSLSGSSSPEHALLSHVPAITCASVTNLSGAVAPVAEPFLLLPRSQKKGA